MLNCFLLRLCGFLFFSDCISAYIYRVAQKSKPPPIFQKIALKIANEIRFLREVKV